MIKIFNQKFKCLLTLCCLLPCISVFADSNTNKPKKALPQPGKHAPKQFSFSISLGGVLNTGNSNAYNLTTGANISYNHKKWITTGSFQSQIGGDRTSGLSSRNYNLQGESKYFFAPPTCFFYALGNYTLDAFNTYRTVLLTSVGYGKRVINRKYMTLDLQGGPEFTRRRVAGSGKIEAEPGVLASADYIWTISSDIQFNQSFYMTKDKLNFHTEAVSALTTSIISDLALKLSFSYKHNTNIPPESSDTEKTDTVTNISVVYSF